MKAAVYGQDGMSYLIRSEGRYAYSVECRLLSGMSAGLDPRECAFAEDYVERMPGHSTRHERRNHWSSQRRWKSIHTDASTATNHRFNKNVDRLTGQEKLGNFTVLGLRTRTQVTSALFESFEKIKI